MDRTPEPAEMTPPEPSPWMASNIAQALLHFLSGIRSIPSVEKVAYSSDGGQLDIWVLQSSEELEDAEQIYLLERAMRQRASLLPLTVHVVPLSEVSEANLPPTHTLHERSRAA